MELDELIEEVTSAADKSAELRKRDLSLKNKYEEICERNYEKIVAPYIEKMDGVVEKIHDKSNVYIEGGEITLIKNSNIRLDLEMTTSGVRPYCYFTYNNSRNYSTALSVSVKLDYWYWEKMEEYFLTEEGALRFIDALAGAYCEVFEKFRVAISEKNQNLADSIQKLEEALKVSSAPKENEDGTVEFHINGKTYVGTVKEE